MNTDPTTPDPELEQVLTRLDAAETGEDYASALSAFYMLAVTRAGAISTEAFEQLLRGLAARWRAHAASLPAREREVLLACAVGLERLCRPTPDAPLLRLSEEQVQRALNGDPWLARASSVPS